MNEILSDIAAYLEKGKFMDVKSSVQEALDMGIGPQEILDNGLLRGMDVVSEMFKKNKIFIPQILVAARAMYAGLDIIKPLIVQEGIESPGTVVIGTAKGDMHDIGKNLVKMMMESKGLDVIDLGANVSSEKFVETAMEHDADIIACSALLTTTMNQMENTVLETVKRGIRDRVKIMVGGAPVNQEFCDVIGADIYTSNAASAAEIAVELCKATN